MNSAASNKKSEFWMGVPTFYRWLCQKYPKVLKDCQEDPRVREHSYEYDLLQPNPNGEFDNLYLDMNGIIHPCSHPEEGSQPETEVRMFRFIFAYIERLVNIVRPKRLLYLAIDGVAPRAKMNQQRVRRFKAALEIETEERIYEELAAEFEKDGRPAPPRKPRWDSNVITPGTPYMESMTKALRFWIQYKLSTDPGWKHLRVVLTDSNSPGEGEHKIVQFIRSERHRPDYDPNTRHVLHGQDADLIMLALATHEAHFFILREEVTAPTRNTTQCSYCKSLAHSADDCPDRPALDKEAAFREFLEGKAGSSEVGNALVSFKSTWKNLQFVQIAVLREYLFLEFNFEEKLTFPHDKERVLDDFVFMVG